MPDRALTVGDIQQHAQTLGAMLSALLTGLAAGKYDQDVAINEDILSAAGIAFPPAAMVEKGLEVFLAINKMTAPRGPIVPDDQGGFVPASNSRYDPKTGKFLSNP